MNAIELVAGPVTEPCVGSLTYHAATIGFLLGLLGFCALVLGLRLIATAAARLRESKFGKALLDACAKDDETAEKTIQSVRDDTDLIDTAIRRTLRIDDEYSRRLADFNQACRDSADGGPRWQDVQ